MDKKLWFRRKLYGWGWTPCSWEGWLVTFLYLALIIVLSIILGNEPTGRDATFRFFIPAIIATLVFIKIAYNKGEKPMWQWGKRRED